MYIIKNYGAGNYRNFNEYFFKLSGITLLTGKNNSGKSSSGKLYQFLKDNYQQNGLNYLDFSWDNIYGGIENVLGLDKEKPLEINFLLYDRTYGSRVIGASPICLPEGMAFNVRYKAEGGSFWLSKLEIAAFDHGNELNQLIEIESKQSKKRGDVHIIKVNIGRLIYSTIQTIDATYKNIEKWAARNKLPDIEEIGNFPIKRFKKLKDGIIDKQSLRKLVTGETNIDYLSQVLQNLIIEEFSKPKEINEEVWNSFALNTRKFTGAGVEDCLKIWENISFWDLDKQHKNNEYNLFNSSLLSILERKPDVINCFKVKEINRKIKLNEILNKEFKEIIEYGIKELCNFLIDDLPKSFEFHSFACIPSQGVKFFGKQDSNILIHKVANLYREHGQYLDEEDDKFISKWLQRFEIDGLVEFDNYKNIGGAITIHEGKKEINISDMGSATSNLLGLVLLFPLLKLEKKQLRSSEVHKFLKKHISGKLVIPTILIEEPETRLHPNFQSLLADFFVDVFNSYQVHLVIETHSEYLIRKIQLLVSKKQLNHSEALIYYFDKKKENGKESIEVREIDFYEDGTLSDEFGTGFFDEADNLAIDLYNLNKSQRN